MLKRLLSVFLGLASVAEAQEVTYRFVWDGSNGYGLRGAMSFEARALDPVVRENDVICFEIEGHHEDRTIGRWALTMLNEETSWRLHFDRATEAFVVHGAGVDMPQAWNMNGAGNDCGLGGFGFNIGNLAQDLCLNDRLIFASQTDPRKPLTAVRDDSYRFAGDACNGPDLLGALQ